MRKLLTLFIVLICGTALHAATLKRGLGGVPKSIDPHKTDTTWDNDLVGDMFLGLTTENAKAEAVAGAAEKWDVSPDGKTYVFHLRSGLQWSDGTALKAEDYVYSIRRALKPETAAQYASLLFIIQGATEYNTAVKKADGSPYGPEDVAVKALDDQRIEFQLTAPAAYFSEILAHQIAMPVPRHVIEKHGDDWTKPGHHVSNGAYQLKSFIPSAEVVAVKNDKFWDAANVKFDEIIYYPDEDKNSGVKAFRAGERDLLRDISSDQVKQLKQTMPEVVRQSPYFGTYYYTLNTNKDVVKDVRVRRALNLAVDRDIITQKVLGTGEVSAYSLVPLNTPHYQSVFQDFKDKPYAERLDEAKKLMAEAGYGPEKPLKFTLRYKEAGDDGRIAVAIAQMWKAIGVEAELLKKDSKVHYEEVQNSDYEVARVAWIGDFIHPYAFLFLLETTTGKLNYGRWSNQAYDELIKKALLEQDEAKQIALFQDAEKILFQELPILPIYHYVAKFLVSTKIGGFEDNVKDIHRSRFMFPK